MGDDVAALVHLELAGEQLRVRLVADGDEDAVDGHGAPLRATRVLEHDAGHTGAGGVADDLAHGDVPDEADLRIPLGALLHDLRRPQLIAAVQHVDARRVLGEVRRLLHRGVAAADDRELLVLEEEAVARRAGRDAIAHEALLGG